MAVNRDGSPAVAIDAGTNERLEGCIRCDECARVWHWANVARNRARTRTYCDECARELNKRTVEPEPPE